MRFAFFVLLLNFHLILGNKLGDEERAAAIERDIRQSLARLLPDYTNLRYRRSAKDAGINLLRLYLCEVDYRNCLNDNRYGRVGRLVRKGGG